VIGVARELTKTHEELVIEPILAVIARFQEPRGEFTVLLPPKASALDDGPAVPDGATLRAELGRIAKSGKSGRREALKLLAAKYGLSVNDLYKLLES
jgi:16S rRNA (cytidine1402-2'-O)-methyltransferase